MSKTKPTFFTVERKDTDKSLTAEREKTNESLMSARKLIEKQTDLFVKNERIETDQARSTTRDEADAERDNLRGQSSVSDTILTEQKASDDQLIVERRAADLAINDERSKADSALVHERERKKSKTEDVLNQERVSTDRNLSIERSQTDSEVEQTAGRLSDEITNHLKTKTSLTSRDEFLAIVSHDLRNPIGAILTCAGMLLEDFGAEVNSNVKQYIQLIQRNAYTGLRLIEDILDMESIAMGKFKLKLEKTCIGPILSEVQDNFTLIAREKSIDLQVLQKNLSAELICDRERVKQIITNLIANAIKFTGASGIVRVEVNSKNNKVEVSVQDNGSGIPESKQEQIFERFAQLRDHDRRGLGLGLYISRMLTEAHQGQLWVQSEVGKGSQFYVSLPGLRNQPLLQ